MDLTPGTLLNNRYRYERQLGKGGMGAVYLAFDVSLEHQVAVKINHQTSEASIRQFLREAHLLASLRSPNLPRVIDYFVLEQGQYLVMDYIPGDNLEDRLKNEGAQPLDKVLYWANQLGSALSYLHEQNPPVIHRDIKPANIKLTPEGQVILVDFGIAKTAEADQATAAGAAGYTPGFAPPEQYGTARTGPYSDQYAFAATLYTLLSGQRPIDAIQRVLGQATLTPLRSLNPHIPAYIDAAIQRGMAVKPEDRFPTIADFVAELSGEMTTAANRGGDTVHTLYQPTSQATVINTPAETVVVARPAVKPPRRWPAAGLIGAALIVLCLVAGAGTGIFLAARNNWFSSSSPTPTQTAQVAVVVAPPIISSPIPPLPTQTQPPVPTQALPIPTDTSAPTATEAPTLEPSPTSPAVGNGGVIAFSSNRADGKTFQIWTMRVSISSGGQVTASDLNQLTSGEGHKTQPTWSPDGTKLLYVAPGGSQNGKNLGLDIWVMNADGASPVDLTKRPGDDTDPAWSPDGSQIAFNNNGREDKVNQLYLMAPDGSQQVRLSIDFNEKYPTWSPDMQWLAYVISANNYPFLYVRGKSGSYQTPEPYDTFSVNGRLGQVGDPAWSPDGTQIVYTRLDGGHEQIWSVIASSHGADLSRLTQGNSDRQPAWSPDSKWIVYSSGGSGGSNIWLMTSAGTLQTALTQDTSQNIQPAWQPLSPGE